MPDFVHLHNHTQFSLLDGAAQIDKLVDKACSCGMKAVGISDHGNLYGVPKFVMAARKKGIKPIIGSEFYLAPRYETPEERKNGQRQPTYHQILFAKNRKGYQNLIRLSSLSFTEGFYYKPRITHEQLQAHHEGLIATTCCLASEVNQSILRYGPDKAQELFKWFLHLFGEDYYVEVQDHNLGEQHQCNEVLLGWAQKFGVPVMATNDVHYVDQEDAEAHDLLLALQTGKDLSSTDRFRFTDDKKQLNPRFYFKTPEEMAGLFGHIPGALDNTLAIAEKCDFELDLTGDLILPTYQVPEGFDGMDAYLKHLALEGAKQKYGELTTEITERIDHELAIIKQMGYAGYFLIVQEFTAEARKRGVLVGPGRGSAAGSVVAYCTGIIDVDPLAYNLIFERFLNPERVSPPDIDIDFDDEGREEVINFVVEKYGRQSVSQIITYGTMGAKTAIRDVGRVMNIPLAEVNRVAKLIPDRPGMSFKKALTREHNPDHYQELLDTLNSPSQDIARMMKYAQTLEGTARHTGIHAAGVIIAPGDISNYVPVSINNTKDEIITTQFDGPSAELAGMLKMDFLGLKTLTIIKNAVKMVQKNHRVQLDIDNVDLTDEKTFELYQAGDTVATFQFESDGMRKYLRQLKPTTIEDLIAMNALYRPGPMDNIPLFIERKHNPEKTEYPHELLKPILENTYGIMVYQEQIMEAARVMAGYSLGGADLLRRAMGKKKADVMAKERVRFIEGAKEKGISEDKAKEVFDTMEKFASYGFNKSHSAAYSLLAFRTMYLKAHYPAEYMTSVLSSWLDSIEKISFFIEETRRMGIPVLPPSVNESSYLFDAIPARTDEQKQKNPMGIIRFGLGAIKGVGRGVAEAIINEREANGPYEDPFDLVARLPANTLNRRILESLVYAGAFDDFGIERWHYIATKQDEEQGTVFLDKLLQYGRAKQEEANSNQASLFGEAEVATLAPPAIPRQAVWPLVKTLNAERDVIGFYLSAHPLDEFDGEIKAFTTSPLDKLERFQGKAVRIAGIVTGRKERLNKRGSKFGIFTLADKQSSIEFALFGEDWAKHNGALQENDCVFIKGTYQPRFNNPDEYELRVQQVEPLEGLFGKYTNRVRLHVPLSQVQPSFMDELEAIFAKHRPQNGGNGSPSGQGTSGVSFAVTDETSGLTLKLNTQKLRVLPSAALFRELSTLGVGYQLSRRD